MLFVNRADIINSFKYLNRSLQIKSLNKYLTFKNEGYYVDKITGMVFNKTNLDDEKQIKLYSLKVYKKQFTQNTYSSNIPAVIARHRYVYEIIINNLKIKNKKIVDVGAGDGNFLDLFPNKKLLLGIEPKKENCNLMKKKKIKSLNTSILKAQLNNEYDIATLIWTACVFNNPYKSIKKLSKCIKKNGYLVIAESSRIMVHPKKDIKYWVGTGHRYFNPNLFSKNSLINLLKICGFRIKFINRYYDTDHLVIIAQNTHTKFNKFEVDDYKKILKFFKHWEKIDKFLK
jgi:SAM-dependent methyltransferase